MLERTVDLEMDRAYSELKTILLKQYCRIVSEEPPKHLLIKHGSLHGITPRSAKKSVNYQISSQKSKTRIASFSTISSDWINLTLWGSIIAGISAAIFWWIASDITTLIVDGKSGFWTWLAGAFGYPDVQYTLFMINITKALSIVLVITILLEILDFLIVYNRIDTFAKETIDELSQK